MGKLCVEIILYRSAREPVDIIRSIYKEANIFQQYNKEANIQQYNKEANIQQQL